MSVLLGLLGGGGLVCNHSHDCTDLPGVPPSQLGGSNMGGNPSGFVPTNGNGMMPPSGGMIPVNPPSMQQGGPGPGMVPVNNPQMQQPMANGPGMQQQLGLATMRLAVASAACV